MIAIKNFVIAYLCIVAFSAMANPAPKAEPFFSKIKDAALDAKSRYAGFLNRKGDKSEEKEEPEVNEEPAIISDEDDGKNPDNESKLEEISFEELKKRSPEELAKLKKEQLKGITEEQRKQLSEEQRKVLGW